MIVFSTACVWVSHGGVIAQGTKTTIDIGGARCTPDHLILTEQGWKPALHVALDDSSMLRAHALASGLLCGSSATHASVAAGRNTSTSASAAAGKLRAYLANLEKASRVRVLRAQKANPKTPTTSPSACASRPNLLLGSPTASTPYVRVVSAGLARTNGTQVGYRVPFRLREQFIRYCKRLKGFDEPSLRLIGKTTTPLRAGNLRFATRKQQCANRRGVHKIKYRGGTYTAAEFRRLLRAGLSGRRNCRPKSQERLHCS